MPIKTVKDLIEVLKICRDGDIAPIAFYYEDMPLMLDSVSQFGICADVTMHFKQGETPPDIAPAIIQRRHKGKIAKVVRRIRKRQSQNNELETSKNLAKSGLLRKHMDKQKDK